nr:MAG: RNA-dependent RNA polymerase [Riboviria sp.]
MDMRPSQVIITLEALFSKNSGHLRRNGEELTALDNSTAQEVYQLWSLLLLDLGYLPREEDVCREVGRFYSALQNKDVLSTLNISAELLQLVYRRIPCGIKGFKALCSSISPNLYNLVKSDVEKTVLGDAMAAKRMIQFFAFPSRLTLVDIDLTKQCLDDYLLIEDNYQSVFAKSIVGSLNTIVKRWLKGIDLNDLAFKHGKGSTAGGIRNIEDKYKGLSSDILTKYAFGDTHLPSIDGEQTLSFSPFTSHLTRCSQTIFVPKSYKTFRTISMEPVTLMFLQQGIWNAIDDHVNRVPFLRERIGFHDQERNKVLAQRGSLHRDFATIDLSAASDSVGWQLVKDVFRGTPLLRYLFATRSTHTVLPDGQHIPLKKFAPMGSALCFPIETIIFAACCEFVTREHGFFGEYSVFGDDIIVPTECVDDLFYVLDVLGFIPNRDKSFYQSEIWFRESCGGEYIDGHDVTPLRISRWYTSRHDEDAVQGLLDMANTCLDRDFKILRRFILHKIEKIGQETGYIPYFSPTHLRSPGYSNWHTKRRWNHLLQRIECFVTVMSTKHSDRNDDIAYYEYLRSVHFPITEDSTPVWLRELDLIPSWDEEGSVTQTGRTSVLFKRRWAEKPYESIDDNFIEHFTGYNADVLI